MRIDKSILVLFVGVALLGSCDPGLETSQSSPKELTFGEPFVTEIDSSLWLRPTSGVRGVLEDSRGYLWFTSTEYVCRFDGTAFTYFGEEEGLNDIGTVYEDANGTIWIVDGFKAYRFDGKTFAAHELTPDTTGNKWAVAAGDLWFQKGIPPFGNSSSPPGVYRYRAGEIDFLAFPLPKTRDDDRMYYPTTPAVPGKDGTLWFGTMEKVIGFKDGGFTLIGREEMGREEDPRQVGIRGLYVDRAGQLWMADNGSGLFVYDGNTVRNFTKLHNLDEDDREGNTLHRAFSVAEDREGNMWFGTVYAGIWRYDGSSFTNYTEKDGVISQSIWTIYETKKGELLFAGERPGAVYQFNGTSFDRVY